MLLFLHADTLLPDGAMDAIREAMNDKDAVGGAFRLAIEPATFLLRVVAKFVNLRSRFLHLPYGDQAIFVRRGIFDELGGFAKVPIMEDVDLVRRLNKKGRMVLLKQFATTSGRRRS